VAFIIDVYSRRLVGWKAARSMTADLVIDALNMAAWTRRHTTIDGLIHHSDRGVQGGINWSSQHLNSGGVQCVRRTDRKRFACIGATFLPQDGHQSRGEKTESSFGQPSLAA